MQVTKASQNTTDLTNLGKMRDNRINLDLDFCIINVAKQIHKYIVPFLLKISIFLSIFDTKCFLNMLLNRPKKSITWSTSMHVRISVFEFFVFVTNSKTRSFTIFCQELILCAKTHNSILVSECTMRVLSFIFYRLTSKTFFTVFFFFSKSCIFSGRCTNNVFDNFYLRICFLIFLQILF